MYEPEPMRPELRQFLKSKLLPQGSNFYECWRTWVPEVVLESKELKKGSPRQTLHWESVELDKGKQRFLQHDLAEPFLIY